MRKFTLIELEWNEWNGFVFTLFGLEFENFEGELLGLHTSKDHLLFSICFLQMSVSSPFL
jgi:hypothetical protein